MGKILQPNPQDVTRSPSIDRKTDATLLKAAAEKEVDTSRSHSRFSRKLNTNFRQRRMIVPEQGIVMQNNIVLPSLSITFKRGIERLIQL